MANSTSFITGGKMAKQKLSRDQKRKQKKRKQQRKQKSSGYSSKWSNLKVKMLKPGDEELERAIAATNFDAQEARLLQVFNEEEIPGVNAATLQTYFDYIKERIEVPCLLTGIESMGYFGWEERFEFGYGRKAEYEQLRKERGSYHDQYELEEFEAVIEDDWDSDIMVKVKRTTDGKRFTIPLSELEAVDQASANYVLLNDYTVWMVNWR
jgi:hypothetical protein